jgi:hypothetical protein
MPLPPVRFNHETGSKQILDADMMAYTRKLFSPLRHDHLFHDFPPFLHQAATLLESRSSPARELLAQTGEQFEEGTEQPEPQPTTAISRKGIVPKAQPRAKGEAPEPTESQDYARQVGGCGASS